MSTVRMCDFTMPDGKVCGTIFSEREVGWSTGSITVVADPDSMDSRYQRTHTESIDLCPDHSPANVGQRKVKYPRLLAAHTPDNDDPWAEEKKS